jgi:carnitine-CoA ligase
MAPFLEQVDSSSRVHPGGVNATLYVSVVTPAGSIPPHAAVDLSSVRTVGALLRDAAADRPDDDYLLVEDAAYSFRMVDRYASSIAGALMQSGVARGDRVLVVLPNAPAFLFVFLGVARLGATLVPVNPRSTVLETAAALAAAAPRLVVTDPAHSSAVREASETAGVTASLLVADDLMSGSEGDAPDATVSADDIAVMFLTSGTTGVPKLVMQSHRALVLAAEGFPWWLGLDSTDRLLTALPLFHINALAYSALGSLAAQASFVLLSEFSASKFWDEIRAYDATEFNVVGAMLEILARRSRGVERNPARICYSALAPPTRERHEEIERRFGLELVAGYGLSECPYGTIWPLGGPAPYGSMGRLKQHPTLGEISAARVVDDDDRDVPDGVDGELLLRNPAVMAGYFNRDDETNAALKDGWLHTGDVVSRDGDGNFHFVARKKEVIRRRGENIAPGEIEAALMEHPSVVEAVAVGVPSELGEDDVKAFVVAGPGRMVDLDELHASCAGRLTSFKVPRYIEVIEDFPRTPTGRVARHDLPRERRPAERDFG